MSFSTVFRKQLDSAMRHRSWWFWFISPLLVPISSVWFVVASCKRIRSIPRPTNSHSPFIICVGNTMAGGTGKSPIIRALAKKFAEKNHPIAIAAKGIGPKNIIPDHEHQPLSDENIEHFFLLNQGKINVKIYQGQDRYLAQNDFRNPNGILLLDDGMQNLKLNRHLDICVIQPELALKSPGWCIPMGPYRDQTFAGIAALHRSINFRFWSRCSIEYFQPFLEKVRQVAEKWDLTLHPDHDVIVIAQHTLHRSNSAFNLVSVENLQSLELKNCQILTGIAHSDLFQTDAIKFFKNLDYEIQWQPTLSLPDHAALTENILSQLASTTILMTMKDWLRWNQSELFQQLYQRRQILILQIDVEFKTLLGDNWDIAHLLPESLERDP